MVEKVADHYTLHKTTLYKLDESTQDTIRQPRNCQVIPRTQLNSTLKQLHNLPLAGHLGLDNTYLKAMQHYYWPGMKTDIIQFIQTCKICQQWHP